MAAASADVPPFSTTKPRFDLSTFQGRLKQMFMQTNPRYLFVSASESEKAKKLQQEFDDGTLPKGVTDAQLWAARTVTEATMHPETKQTIFPAFRFCAFSPSNLVIASVMLNPAVIASPTLTLGAHWINQSYNAAINYANRNASNPISNATLAKAYAGAIVTSCSIALGATYLTKRAANLSAGVRTLIRSTLPFAAVAGAGFANVALIRSNELTDGVDLFDEEGTVHGKSAMAGKVGIIKCGIARVLWNIPIMVVPPIVMSQLEKLKAVQRSRGVKIATELGVMAVCLFTGVPPALAFFPQKDTIEASKVEPEYQHLRDSKGNEITHFIYSKGL